MRWLSMSLTRKPHNSVRRMPVEYSVMSIVRVKQIAGRVDQPRHFLRTQDLRQFATALRTGQIVEQEMPLQRLDVEKRSPATCCCTVPASSFRSRNR
jgi:hypothetical protein